MKTRSDNRDKRTAERRRLMSGLETEESKNQQTGKNEALTGRSTKLNTEFFIVGI